MTTIDRIREEIERKQKDARDHYHPNQNNDFLFGMVTLCDELLEFIDYLEDEK